MADFEKKIRYTIELDEPQARAEISKLGGGMAIAVPLEFAPGRQAPPAATPSLQPSPTPRTSPQSQAEPSEFGGRTDDIVLLLSGIEDRVSECCRDLGMLVSKIEDHLADGFRDLGMLTSKIENHLAAQVATHGQGQQNASVGLLLDTLETNTDAVLSIEKILQQMLESTWMIQGSTYLTAQYTAAKVAQGTGGNQQPNPTEKSGPNWESILPRLVSLGVGMAGYAANPMNVFGGVSAAGGVAGAIVGGPMGIAISTAAASISTMATAAMNAAESLKNYNGAIFSAMTGFDLFMMGFRFQLAGDIAPAITKIVAKVEELLVAMEPLIAEVIELASDALQPVIDHLIRFVQAILVAIDALEFMVASINRDTNNLNDAMWKFTHPHDYASALLLQNQESSIESLTQQHTAGQLTDKQFKSQLDMYGLSAIQPALTPDVVQALMKGNLAPLQAAVAKLMPGLPTGQSKAQLDANVVTTYNKFIGALDKLYAPVSSAADSLKEMLANGQTIALWLFRGMKEFSHDPKTSIGPQTTGQGGMHPSQAVPSYLNPNYLTFEQMPGMSQLGRFWQATTSNNAITNFVNQQVANNAAQNAPQRAGGQPAATQPTPLLPRPTPAAMSLHIADNVQISPAEDDRLHAEIMQWLDYMREAMDNMTSGRWHRIAEARARVGDW